MAPSGLASPPATAAHDGRPADADETADRTVRWLRQENAELRSTVEVYAEAIRQLAVENEALRQQATVVRILPVRGL